MRTIYILVRKEFLQILRNRIMLPIILVMPLVQLLILSNAATYEIKNIRMHVVDLDNSTTSRHLIEKFTAGGYFQLSNYSYSEKLANEDIDKGDADFILQIPPQFEKSLVKENTAKVQFIINSIDGAAAGLTNAYALSILQDFNRNLQAEWINPKPDFGSGIQTTYSYWFNPQLNYKTFMVPGILVLLVTMIALFLAGMNIVREKEIGTIEQLNVTPISKGSFIIGKLLPFWILGLFELAFGLLLGRLIFHIPMVGNILVVFAFAAIYMLMILGMGLFVSTFTQTQQQAMFISWFFMVIFILMSGLFTPIESMPIWAQKITLFNPVAYFIKVMRMVLLKGSGFADTAMYFLYMAIFALGMNVLAVWNYRKTV